LASPSFVDVGLLYVACACDDAGLFSVVPHCKLAYLFSNLVAIDKRHLEVSYYQHILKVVFWVHMSHHLQCLLAAICLVNVGLNLTLMKP